jgi:hypothetical protein
MRITPQTPSLAERIAALETRAGIRPSEAVERPVPPPMSHLGSQQRTTMLVSTEQGRAVNDRRAARAAAMAQHAKAGRFF